MVRVYHFLNRQFGLQNLAFRRLKIATLDDINDPFELMATYSRDADGRRALRRFKREWGKRFGMLCFSKTWQNPVHWSHYAEKHRGICLGFDVADERLTEVEYVERRLKPNWVAIKSPDVALAQAEVMRWSSTKYVHWQYEAEMRAFLNLETCDESGLYFCDFSEGLRLREVIVGATSTITRADVDGLLSTGDCSTVQKFKVRLAFGAYRMVRQKKAEHWT